MEKISFRLRDSANYSDAHELAGVCNSFIDKINELVDEINELKIQLSRVHKDKPDPRTRNPYDLSHQ